MRTIISEQSNNLNAYEKEQNDSIRMISSFSFLDLYNELFDEKKREEEEDGNEDEE